ncbi:MAG: HXXEE domain-containing protein [Lachnospiraceae bacterium]|nr:HXXEE domain-containing protein [Lachnospiraceae bacterium]
MREYILLLPILFIFHDMEEIIGFGWFFRNNPDVFERFPRITKAYKDYTTAGMALAVYEEFIPFFGISLLAYYFGNDVLYTVWFGLFISLAAHFLIHIGQSIYIKKYIPSLITSIICLPIAAVILICSSKYIVFSLSTVLLIAGSILLMIANLRFAHWLMHRFGKQLGI